MTVQLVWCESQLGKYWAWYRLDSSQVSILQNVVRKRLRAA